MGILVSDIALGFELPAEQAIDAALVLLGRPAGSEAHIAKRSVDARKKDRIRFVYTVEVTLPEGEEQLVEQLANPKVRLHRPEKLEFAHGAQRLESRPVIAGFGPAGLFAALALARCGYRPIVLERGADIDTRADKVARFWAEGGLDPDTNVQFGEGGAGAFSDGKLTTRIGDGRCSYVLEELVRHGAPEEILRNARPHIGTDLLRPVVRAIREEIISLGGEVRFLTQLNDLLRGADGGLREVVTSSGRLAAQVLILAPGHSARDSFEMLCRRGATLLPKPFSVGVRIEHRRADIDAALYGRHAGHMLLPAGEYQLSWREGERGVYTFCMCPGGVVVPAASETGIVVTNGMSRHARDGENSNSALVVSVGPQDFGPGALDGVAFQRRLEAAAFAAGGGEYRAPMQTAGRFIAGEAGYSLGGVQPSYARGVGPANLADIFPEPVVQLLRQGLVRFGRKLPGFDRPDALLTGVESRTSSPVRIVRDEDLQAQGFPGLFPCGEGAGYAGGIMSAAVDGLRAAEALMAKWGAPE